MPESDVQVREIVPDVGDGLFSEVAVPQSQPDGKIGIIGVAPHNDSEEVEVPREKKRAYKKRRGNGHVRKTDLEDPDKAKEILQELYGRNFAEALGVAASQEHMAAPIQPTVRQSMGQTRLRAVSGKEDKWRAFTIASLALPPIIISLVSILHMVQWFMIGNNAWLSIALAVSYEALTLASLVAVRQMSIVSRATRAAIWGAIVVLAALQVLGNVFSVYVDLNPQYVARAAELMGMQPGSVVNRIAAILLGSILPITSLAFVKILANYLWVTDRRQG